MIRTPKEEDHLEDVYLDGRTVLKLGRRC